jgi:hypothetical protein
MNIATGRQGISRKNQSGLCAAGCKKTRILSRTIRHTAANRIGHAMADAGAHRERAPLARSADNERPTTND